MGKIGQTVGDDSSVQTAIRRALHAIEFGAGFRCGDYAHIFIAGYFEQSARVARNRILKIFLSAGVPSHSFLLSVYVLVSDKSHQTMIGIEEAE